MKLSRNFTSIECIIFTQLSLNRFESNNLDQNNSNLVYDKDIILEFKLNIISSNLSKTTHYTSYQQKFYLWEKNMKKVIYSILTLGF